MTEDCTVRGFTIFYPGNPPDAAPAPYPWTIAMSGNNNAVQVSRSTDRVAIYPHTTFLCTTPQDVELLNSWNGIYAVLAARHYSGLGLASLSG